MRTESRPSVEGSHPDYRILLAGRYDSGMGGYIGVLRDRGFLIILEQDFDRVEKCLADLRPDAVIIDVESTGESSVGWSNLLAQGLDASRVPLLVLVSGSQLPDCQEWVALAGGVVFTKPVEPAAIARVLTARLEQARENDVVLSRLKRSLYEREREHLAVNEHSIVSFADRRGVISYVNDKFCQVSGYSREELLGQNHRIVKSDEHDAEFYRGLWQTISSGRVWQGEICNRRKDGGRYWVESTIVPFMGREGRPYQYASIRTDITHVKEAQLSLRAARDEADRANRAKSEFLSSMSHELRTPLNAILGFAQLMEYDDTLPAEHVDNVGEILKAGRHLLALISEVLDLARIEAGRMKLSLEPVEVAALLDECLACMSVQAGQQGILLERADTTNAMVRADRTRLKQVLLNLLSNAIKYNRPGGRVTLSCTVLPDAARLRIAVRDTGRGLTPAQLDRLFEPFERFVDGDSGIEGTGIGLTITRHLVDMMAGTLMVWSEAGKGSEFRVDLPLESLSVGDGAKGGDGEAV